MGAGRNGPRARGFTLVELLIAISLTGLILTILFAGLRVGSRSWDAVELSAAENSELRLVRGFVEGSLRQMRGLSQAIEGEERQMFGGTAEGIEFLTPMGGYLGQGGLYVVRLELRDARDGGQLVLTRWLYHPEVLEGGGEIPEWRPLVEGPSDFRQLDAEPDQALREIFGQQVLFEPVEEVAFAYYGIPDGETEPAWYDGWDDPRGLPLVVRMQVRMEAGWWPDIYVALPEPDASRRSRFGGRRPVRRR
jgi:general secretion pathway protein J